MKLFGGDQRNPLSQIQTIKRGAPEYIRPQTSDTPTMPDPHFHPNEGQMFQNKAIVSDVTAFYEVKAPAFQTEFDEVRLCYDMFEGRQWTDEEVERLRKQGRKAEKSNIIKPVIIAYDAMCGRSMPHLRAYARQSYGTDNAEAMTELLSYSLDQCKYYRKKRRVFTDACIGRRGVTSWWWQATARFPEGELQCARSSQFDYIWDVDSPDLDINKGRFIIERRYMTPKKISQLWAAGRPDMKEYIDRRASILDGPYARNSRDRSIAQRQGEISNASWTKSKRGGLGNMGDESLIDSGFPASYYYDPRRGMAMVLALHERKTVDYTYVYIPGEEAIPITPEQEKDREFMGAILARFGLEELDNVVQQKEIDEYWVTVVSPVLCPEYVLAKSPYSVQSVVDDLGFSHKFLEIMDYNLDRGKRVGVVDDLMDQQRSRNSRITSMNDWIKKNITPDRIYDRVSVKDAADVASWENPEIGAIRMFDSSQGGQLPRFEYPNPSLGNILLGDMQRSEEEVQKQYSVNPNVQGRAQNKNESGTVFNQRVQAAEGQMAPFMETLTESMLNDGNFAIQALCRHITDERKIAVIDDGGRMKREIVVNGVDPHMAASQWDITLEFEKYGCRIDETAPTKAEREKTFADGMQLVATISNPTVKDAIIAELAKYSGIAGHETITDIINKGILLTLGPQWFQSFEELFNQAQSGQDMEILMKRLMAAHEAGMLQGLSPGASPIPEGRHLEPPKPRDASGQPPMNQVEFATPELGAQAAANLPAQPTEQ